MAPVRSLLLFPLASLLFSSACSFEGIPSELSATPLPPPANVAPEPPRNIVGDDDRKDAHEVSNYQAALMDNYVVSITSQRKLKKKKDGRWKARLSSPLSESTHKFVGFENGVDFELPICNDVKFAKQERLSGCSGTLISENVVVTAAHCLGDNKDNIETEAESWCRRGAIVFGYDHRVEGQHDGYFEEDEVYTCERILQVSWGKDRIGHADWAFILLDRPVVGHTPASVVGRNNMPKVGDRTVGMYHPKGLPTKYDDGGRVTQIGQGHKIESTLDTFKGCSGGGVFDADHQLVGVHVGSASDFIQDYQWVDGERVKCVRHNTLEDKDRNGSDHMRIDHALNEFCDHNSYYAPQACRSDSEADACTPCEKSSDCGYGVTCLDRDGEGVGRCSYPCSSHADCSKGSYCSMVTTGWCVPVETSRCLDSATELKLDACGVPSEAPRTCPVDSQCLRGRCQYSFSPQTGDSCNSPIKLNIGLQVPRARVHGSTQYGSDSLQPSCANPDGLAAVYKFTLERKEAVRLSVFGHDTVLSIRSECESVDSEVGCNDGALGDIGHQASGLFRVLEAGSYSVIVHSDAQHNSSLGTPFQLDMEIVDLGFHD